MKPSKSDPKSTRSARETGSWLEQFAIPEGSKAVNIKIEPVPGKITDLSLNFKDGSGRTIQQQQRSLKFAGSSRSIPPFRYDFFFRLQRFWKNLVASNFKRKNSITNVGRVTTGKHKLENWLFIAAVAIYLFTRLISLPNFPIYFFTDEAVQTVLAGDFIRDGARNYDKEIFPTYFVNGNQYNLGPSVYLQIIPMLLFGKSIWVTRGTAVLATLMAAIAVGLIFKNIIKTRYYWIATLLLSITPAWFLHSRTAFETSLSVSFFALFLYFYLMYRYRNPNYIYPAVVAAALCFYSYSPAQMVMAVIAAALWFSDLRYHWQNKKTIFIALGVILASAIPYIRFLVMHSGENYQHLLILQSYWLSNMTIGQKLLHFLSEWLRGLNPLYWYIPNTIDFVRHLMKGYGHILIYTLPFFLVGLVVCIRKFRESAYRALLFALLAAPAGATLVELGITRALFVVIPVALISTVGVITAIGWLERIKISKLAFALPVFAVLVSANSYMTWDALKNGPLWYQDYGLGGMQYGASQLFGEVKTYLAKNPGTQLIVSPSWANGTDVIARFFFKDMPFQMASTEGYIENQQEIKPNTVFVVIPEEYARIIESNKFTDISIQQVIPYPNGNPGFYFLTMRYDDNIADIFAKEAALRRQLVTEPASLQDGAPFSLSHSLFDMGQVSDLFDGNNYTVTRTAEANPMKLNFDFGTEHTFSGVTIRVGGVKSRVTVTVYPSDRSAPEVFIAEKDRTADPRDLTISFERTIQSARLDIEVLSVDDAEPAHVHVWEVTFW